MDWGLEKWWKYFADAKRNFNVCTQSSQPKHSRAWSSRFCLQTWTIRQEKANIEQFCQMSLTSQQIASFLSNHNQLFSLHSSCSPCGSRVCIGYSWTSHAWVSLTCLFDFLRSNSCFLSSIHVPCLRLVAVALSNFPSTCRTHLCFLEQIHLVAAVIEWLRCGDRCCSCFILFFGFLWEY